MKLEPYKIKAEIFFESNDNNTAINAKALYVCDGEACEHCNPEYCQMFGH